MLRPSGHELGSWGQATVPHEAPTHLSQVLGVKGERSVEQSPQFALGAAGQAVGERRRWKVVGHSG